MVSFADSVDIVDDNKDESNNKLVKVSFSTETKKSSEEGLLPRIEKEKEKEIVTYHLGMLKELCIYETSLRVPHPFGSNIEIEFKHTSNLTILDISPILNEKSKQLDGHILKIQIHPQKALIMQDYIDIKFAQKKQNDQSDKNGNNEEKDESQVASVKLRVDAKVLRKDQGTPLLKCGIHCIQGKVMIDTDVSEWDE